MPETTPADLLIVIPSVGDRGTLLPMLERLGRGLDGERAHVVVSLNPVNEAATVPEIEALWARSTAHPGASQARLTVVDAGGPLGFAGACNAGYAAGVAAGGLPRRAVIFLNDDAFPAPGGLSALADALTPEHVTLAGDPAEWLREAERYGRIGLAGAMSNRVAGSAQVQMSEHEGRLAASDPWRYAAAHRQRYAGRVVPVDFVSGFCVALAPGLAQALLDAEPGTPGPWCEDYGIGGYEDDDLCARAAGLGWRAVLAAEVYVHHHGHATLDRHFPGQARGLANHPLHLTRWADSARRARYGLAPGPVLAGYRAAWVAAHDLLYWRASIRSVAPVLDGVAVLACNNPAAVFKAPDWAEVEPLLDQRDKQFLKACRGARSGEAVAKEIAHWVRATWEATPGARHAPVIAVEPWTSGDPDERAQRTKVWALLAAKGAAWGLAMDTDEVLELTVTRATLDRWLAHPDPMVRAFDLGVLHLWGEARTYRVDPPFADGYSSTVHEARLVRINQAAPEAILGGAGPTHVACGKAPAHDGRATRIADMHLLHYGYLRREDRERKYARDMARDPDGMFGGLGWLVREEGVRTAPFVGHHQIGGACLVHGGERLSDLARHLDGLHGLVTAGVLVWTDPGEPPPTWRALVGLFGWAWTSADLHALEDFSACRNAGLNALQALPPVPGWAYWFDPDEQVGDLEAWGCALRRMAQVSDAHGWLLGFWNHRPPGDPTPPNLSETVRLIRLLPHLRYSGRVHETFDVALRALQASGEAPVIRQAPIRLHNPGLAGSDAAVEAKTRFYQRLILRELQDHPDNAGAWLTLALQYQNDGIDDWAEGCFRQAAACATAEGFAPHKELALWHLRQALAAAQVAYERLPEGHEQRRWLGPTVEWLRAHAPNPNRIGLARIGEAPPRRAQPVPPPPVGPEPSATLAPVLP